MPENASADATDVFVSYAQEDRPTAQVLAEALAAAGLSVWWDHELAGGQDFADVIAERLAAARVVLVLWSRAAVNSGFVRDEAARARDAGKLLPVRIEDVQLPLGFGTIHTLDLIGWDGDRDDSAWQELLANVERGAPGVVPQPPAVARRPGRRWRWRWRLVLAALLAALVGGWGLNTWRQQARQAEVRLQQQQKEAQDLATQSQREQQQRLQAQEAQARREQQALAQFQEGLSAHFARDRNLQAARNAYLNALRSNPDLGRAHYYLGHVYALLLLPRDAQVQFALALQLTADLDDAQRDDARVQLAALNLDPEAVPVARSAVPERIEPRPSPPRPPPPDDVGPLRSGRPSTGPPKSAKTLPAPRPPLLPRVAPSPQRQRAIEEQVDGMFAPQAQTRLSAATALALDPGLMADALPLALRRSLAALGEQPVGEAAVAGATNTLQLMLGASPATLNAQRDAALQLVDAAAPLGDNQRATAAQLRELLDKARRAPAPVAFIQIANEPQQVLARRLADRFRASGYAVPRIENVGARAPSRSEVRAQGASVPGWGRWLAKVVGELDGEAVPVHNLRGVRPLVDTFEIWLDRDLCVSRRVPACEP